MKYTVKALPWRGNAEHLQGASTNYETRHTVIVFNVNNIMPLIVYTILLHNTNLLSIKIAKFIDTSGIDDNVQYVDGI